MSAFKPASAVIWVEIPVTDLDKSKAFYGAVLQNELSIDDMGPAPTAVFSYGEGGVGGHLYVGKPSAVGTGNTVHLVSRGAAGRGDGTCQIRWRQGRVRHHYHSARPLRLLP